MNFGQKFAKSRGSMRRLEQPKPRYDPSPFSPICLLLLNDLSFNLFLFTVHPYNFLIIGLKQRLRVLLLWAQFHILSSKISNCVKNCSKQVYESNKTLLKYLYNLYFTVTYVTTTLPLNMSLLFAFRSFQHILKIKNLAPPYFCYFL